MACKEQLIEKTYFILHSEENLVVFYMDRNKGSIDGKRNE
jgi:hypothetical protein